MENKQSLESKRMACFEKYQKDCKQIERQQEDVRLSSKHLESIAEQVHHDRYQMHNLLEKYATRGNGRLAKIAQQKQDELQATASRSDHNFAEEFDRLNKQRRELEKAYDERQQKYRKGLQNCGTML